MPQCSPHTTTIRQLMTLKLQNTSTYNHKVFQTMEGMKIDRRNNIRLLSWNYWTYHYHINY